MEDHCTSVFSSNITRAEHDHQNNLYDLLNIVPAEPLKLNDVKNYTCNYTPKTDKYYISKRKSRLKVKTVRDIRKSFEQDTYSHLFTDLETQQNVLFKKIRYGSSEDDNTKKLAKKIIKDDMPISRSTWQMLININPEQHARPRQFVLWNGRFIQVAGSCGGSTKLICNHDLANNKLSSQNNKKTSPKQKVLYKKKGLLRNSLVVKFKPGPLSKKQFLDDSYQKNVGTVELVNIPKPGLDVDPTYGTAMEPTMVHFLNNLCNKDGIISQKWAELAVSAVGKVEGSNAVQLSRDCVTFELFYKYNQNRLLMRRDTESYFNTLKVIKSVKETAHENIESIKLPVQPEIEEMLDKIISAVEVNILQDKLFTEEQELRPIPSEDLTPFDVSHVKDKSKRKFGELDRLDVTVIRLPETEDRYLKKSCGKIFCSLGCICASLEGTHSYGQHCGHIECMFGCTCDFSEYKSIPNCTDVIPGLLNLNDKKNLKLAKEEQKFHQTVIVTGKKRILLKGERRNWKTSKKYADFYSNMSLKNENQKKQDLSILALKLDCNNVEPWCMVHKLYKCFCKGKFTETCVSVSNDTIVKEPSHKEEFTNLECLETNSKDTKSDSKLKGCVQPRSKFEGANLVKKSKTLENLDSKSNKIRHTSRSLDEPKNSSNVSESNDSDNETVKDMNEMYEMTNSENMLLKIRDRKETRYSSRILNKVNSNKNKHKKTGKISDSESSDYSDVLADKGTSSCSRTKAYEGRKYSDGYYKNTNYKILEMEKNDKRLQERLATLNKTTLTVNKSSEENTVKKPTVKTTNATSSLLELLCDVKEMPVSKSSDNEIIANSKRKRLSSETKLVAWLESNYKRFKQRNDQGLFKNSLEPPVLGKVALHSWGFILKRYRERKNLFLVSQQKPFRIFMAVDTNSHLFENCININDIRFVDLYKYPQTVKNLLINATNLKDNFCILRGLSCCWELIGSVTKVNESNQRSVEHEGTPEINAGSSHEDTFIVNKPNDTADVNHPLEKTEQTDIKTDSNTEKDIKGCTASSEDAGSSKWFVMTIEHDFSEIRFFRKGFFVKSETIINAIHVARLSGKTVRLSSKKCIEQSEVPQFGIYAIPNNYEYCVFVGPYEMEDTLGIETIKTILDVRKLNRTRGFWITTNKVDNMKVVENPFSFVPITNVQNNKAIPLETSFSANDDLFKDQQGQSDIQESVVISRTDESKECSPTKKEMKIVKPIKIRKTNGFYHLASDGVLKKISLPYAQNISNGVPMVLNACTTKTLPEQNIMSNNAEMNCVSETLQEEDCTLIPEAIPQIKISAVFSQNDTQLQTGKRERGMFILKPEEINRKLFQSKLTPETCTTVNAFNIDYDDGAASDNVNGSNIDYDDGAASDNVNGSNIDYDDGAASDNVNGTNIHYDDGAASDNINGSNIDYDDGAASDNVNGSNIDYDDGAASDNVNGTNIHYDDGAASDNVNGTNIDYDDGAASDNVNGTNIDYDDGAAIDNVNEPNIDYDDGAAIDNVNEPNIDYDDGAASDNVNGSNIDYDEEDASVNVNGSIIDYDDGAASVHLIESDADSRSNLTTDYGTLQDDIFIISDDDYDSVNNESINNYNIWKNVWIECTNISNLGWIAGIKNVDNLLSFKFPGCEYSEFYPEEEAFFKINSELLKKIDSSQNLTPEWKVTESSEEVQGQEMDLEHLYPDYMLTREGLLHTSDLIRSNKNNLKTYSKIQLKDKVPCSPSFVIDKVEFLDEQEETSN